MTCYALAYVRVAAAGVRGREAGIDGGAEGRAEDGIDGGAEV